MHSVKVTAFAIDRLPVTVAAYQQYVSAGGCVSNVTTEFSGEHDHEHPSTDCNDGAKGRWNHPINCVDLLQAALYCEWLYKRLPTEEEWEYAAGGTDGRTYPWGNEELGAQACWDRGTARRGACAAGSFPRGASPFGLLDMAGNVGEWTQSKYADDYSKTGSPSAKVTRGGSWSDADPSSLRAASRRRHDARDRDSHIGFRCAR